MNAGADHDVVLQLLADGALAVTNGVLSRIWLERPGDLCDSCVMRSECPDQTACLHLVVSAGQTTGTDGPYRRFPIGARQVGAVPVTHEPFVAARDVGALGLADPTWLMVHDVRSFAALPILQGERCAGVVAVFGRVVLEASHVHALEVLAALAGRAIAPESPRAPGAAPVPAGPAGGAKRPARGPAAATRVTAVAPIAAPTSEARPLPLLREWDDIERDILERVLDHTGGRVSGARGAARILGLRPTTLHSRLKKLGVLRKHG
jgi:Bacterial regulatory protein, Fis family/GAF domain